MLPRSFVLAPTRRLFRTAAALAAVVVIAAVAVVVRGLVQGDGPDGVVRGYFTALRDGDAATALAYGVIPSGSRALLTDRVLARQQQLAPIENVRIARVTYAGDAARVQVGYTLAFASAPHRVAAVLELHHDDGEWHLDHAAVPTQLLLSAATQRATLLGAAVPQGTVLLFPGAAPVDFDTPYLRLNPSRGSIAPDAGISTEVDPEPSDAARTAVTSAVRRFLTGCLTSSTDPRCPLPEASYVPGSVRGTLTGTLSKHVHLQVTADAAGVFAVVGAVEARGRYERLEFDNTVTSETDANFTLPIAAHAYATAPLVLNWDAPT